MSSDLLAQESSTDTREGWRYHARAGNMRSHAGVCEVAFSARRPDVGGLGIRAQRCGLLGDSDGLSVADRVCD